MNCHEVWHFNPRTGCQCLMGFKALCDACHGVKHLLSIRGSAKFNTLANHFMAVNKVEPAVFRAHLRWAREHTKELNRREWKVMFNRYAFVVPALPAGGAASRSVRAYSLR